jgi:hypothetical protein
LLFECWNWSCQLRPSCDISCLLEHILNILQKFKLIFYISMKKMHLGQEIIKLFFHGFSRKCICGQNPSCHQNYILWRRTFYFKETSLKAFWKLLLSLRIELNVRNITKRISLKVFDRCLSVRLFLLLCECNSSSWESFYNCIRNVSYVRLLQSQYSQRHLQKKNYSPFALMLCNSVLRTWEN